MKVNGKNWMRPIRPVAEILVNGALLLRNMVQLIR